MTTQPPRYSQAAHEHARQTLARFLYYIAPGKMEHPDSQAFLDAQDDVCTEQWDKMSPAERELVEGLAAGLWLAVGDDGSPERAAWIGLCRYA